MDEVLSSVFSSEEGDIVACGVGSQPTFHVERKRWADEASESGTSTLGSDVHSCAGDAPVHKKNTVCSSTSHQGSRLSSRNAGVMSEAVLISALRYPLTYAAHECTTDSYSLPANGSWKSH